MATNIEMIESKAMKLAIRERARLAEKLILSLDAPSEEENLLLWVEESERRLRELRNGKARELPSDEVLRRARAAIA